jgi:hypothetical protein
MFSLKPVRRFAVRYMGFFLFAYSVLLYGGPPDPGDRFSPASSGAAMVYPGDTGAGMQEIPPDRSFFEEPGSGLSGRPDLVVLRDDFKVNEDAATCGQERPDIASDARGNAVAVWEDDRDGERYIFGQRFFANGDRAGANFKINDDTGLYWRQYPAVAMDSAGNFIVAWVDQRRGANIFAQRCNSTGSAQGGNFQVNDIVYLAEISRIGIAADSGGAFVVVWRDKRNGPGDIYAQIFDASGLAAGENFPVNDDAGTAEQSLPSVGTISGNRFVVAWEDGREGRLKIYGQIFSFSGERFGGNFSVNDGGGSSSQRNPSVAGSSGGAFAVAWEDERNVNLDIYAQAFGPAGTAVGSAVRVNDDARSDAQRSPDVSVDSAGAYWIVWEDERRAHRDIYGQTLGADGVKAGSNFRVYDDANKTQQWTPTAGSGGNGPLWVCWTEGQGGRADIHMQRFSGAAAKTGAEFMVNDDSGSSWQWDPSIASDPKGRFFAVWVDERVFGRDVYGQRYDENGEPMGANFQINEFTATHGGDAPDVAMDSTGAAVVVWGDPRNGTSDIYCQRFNSNGEKLGVNFLVNDDPGSCRRGGAAVGMAPYGEFVIAWQDYRSGVSKVWAQRYDREGNCFGGNFMVNDADAAGQQGTPDVAVDSSGAFVVTWIDDRKGGYTEIFGQRYNRAGEMLGGNFRINDDLASVWHWNPAVAADPGGGFMAVWRDDRKFIEVYGQRYASDGSPVGGNFAVNPTVPANEERPSIAIDSDGTCVVVWESQQGVFTLMAQRYNAAGAKIGSYIPFVQHPGPGIRREPVVTLSRGKIITAWWESREPGRGMDIYANMIQFRIDTVAVPIISLVPGLYKSPQTVTLSCPTAGASIHYTLNNLEPTQSTPLYGVPILISQNTTIRARAYLESAVQSGIAKAVYTITGMVALPVFEPGAGMYGMPQEVRLSCETPGSELFYTLDGSDPTRSAALRYTAPFTVSATTTVKAMGYKKDWDSSGVATAEYIIQPDGVEEKTALIPTEFRLEQNFPNPFNPGTVFRYQVPKTCRVRLAVYNAQGQRILTIVDQIMAAGYYHADWDGRISDGHPVSSGTYLLRMTADGVVLTKKMQLTR